MVQVAVVDGSVGGISNGVVEEALLLPEVPCATRENVFRAEGYSEIRTSLLFCPNAIEIMCTPEIRTPLSEIRTSRLIRTLCFVLIQLIYAPLKSGHLSLKSGRLDESGHFVLS